MRLILSMHKSGGPKNVPPVEGNNKITNTDFTFSPIPRQSWRVEKVEKKRRLEKGWPVPLDLPRGGSEIDLRRRSTWRAAPPKTGFLLLKSRFSHISPLLAHQQRILTNTTLIVKTENQHRRVLHVKGLVLQLFQLCCCNSFCSYFRVFFFR